MVRSRGLWLYGIGGLHLSVRQKYHIAFTVVSTVLYPFQMDDLNMFHVCLSLANGHGGMSARFWEFGLYFAMTRKKITIITKYHINSIISNSCKVSIVYL